MDSIRLLASGHDRLLASDIHEDTHTALTRELTTLNVAGRSAVAGAKFDTVMLREILDLPGINHTVHGFTVEGQQVREDARVAMVQQLAAQPTSSGAWLHINWYFGHTPQQVNATDERVSELVVSSGQIETTIASTSIITAMGYSAAGLQLVEVDDRAAATGRF